VGPFKDVDIDFTAIAGKLIAVAGENGAGKSTLLELFPGSLFRETPTRGTLVELATARDAFVEAHVVNGAAYVVRQSVDAISKKGEALVLDGTGAPILETSKVRDLDAWTERHIVPPAVLYASQFSAQRVGKKRRGLAEVDRSERKHVLLLALQVERLEAMAENARARAREAQAQVDTLRSRIEDACARTPDMEGAQEEQATCERVVQAAEQALTDARTAFERARQAQADAERKRELVAQRRAVVERLEAARKRRGDLAERLRNNRALLADETVIRGAAAHAEVLERQKTAAEAKGSEASRLQQELHRKEQELKRLAGMSRQRAVAAATRAVKARQKLADKDAIDAAVLALPGLASGLETIDADIAHTETSIAELRRAQLTHKDERIKGLRGALDRIVELDGIDDARDASDVAVAGLRVDDETASAAERAPAAIAEMEAKLAELRRDRGLAAATLRQTEQLAARAQDLRTAAEELAFATDEEQRELADEQKLLEQAKAAGAEASAASVVEEEAAAESGMLAAALATARAQSKHLALLDQAQARIEELEPQLGAVDTDVAGAEAELAQLPDVTAPTVNLDDYERAVRQRTADDAQARKELADACAQVKSATEGAAFLEQLAGELGAAEAKLADWTRLGQDLGKDGVQALEIDAAIPELNTIANDLLHSCAGSRFTIEVSTNRVSGDGKRMIEDLDIRVIDTERGREDSIETFSGGEQVLLAEALSLALTTIACRHAGLQGCTLVRDETGAALDAQNGRAYIAMLRRAVDLIGADKCLFVSHVPELQELADARLVVADGKVEVHS
jgi:exonuclease SbcC